MTGRAGSSLVNATHHQGVLGRRRRVNFPPVPLTTGLKMMVDTPRPSMISSSTFQPPGVSSFDQLHSPAAGDERDCKTNQADSVAGCRLPFQAATSLFPQHLQVDLFFGGSAVSYYEASHMRIVEAGLPLYARSLAFTDRRWMVVCPPPPLQQRIVV